MSVTFTWLGHSAFLFDIDGHKLLVDPFLTDNPLAAMKADEVEAEAILVSHAHGDHVGDTVAIAKRTGAVVVCNFEMGNWFLSKGVENVVQG
ncbi:MAG: MBL fold metallo-hydrolase, partial [Chloroflexi bacterium]